MQALDFRRVYARHSLARRYAVSVQSRPPLNMLPGQVPVRVYSPSGKPLRTVAGRLLNGGRVVVRWRGAEEYGGRIGEVYVLKLKAETEETR